MSYAFDSTTNTPSASFSSSWGIVCLEPSATDQWAIGFKRNQTSRRYFEMKVLDKGGDPLNLFLGIYRQNTPGASVSNPPSGVGYMLGYNFFGEQALLLGTSLTQGGGGPVEATICTSDIYMFIVDFSANDDFHDADGNIVGSLTASESIFGCALSVGKNGIWSLPDPITTWFKYPPLGYYGWTAPAVMRAGGNAPRAVVELQVTTASFAFPIPSGAVAWDEGPQSSLPPTDDATINWDNTKKSSRCSLSGSNLYAVMVGNSAVFTNEFVFSTALPTTGKRYIEFTGQQTDPTSLSNWGNTEWGIGIAEQTLTSITATIQSSTEVILARGNSETKVYKRGVDSSASITNNLGFNANQSTPSFGMMIDFDNARAWFVNPHAPGGSSATPWQGDKQAGTSAYGYSFGATTSNDGLTFTASAGSRIIASIRTDYFHANTSTQIYLKMNPSGPFETYPLLPGATSMNGARYVTAHAGDYWDTVHNPASMTYGAAELVVQARCNPAVAQGRNAFNSGKKYFEIYKESDSGSGTTMDFCFGVRLGSATTMTAAGINIGQLHDTALLFHSKSNVNNGRQARYGVTTTWSGTESIQTTPNGVGMNRWHGVAIDFDNGKIWGGIWNKITHQMNWGAGSDPATGVGAHMTFTASTTMRIAVCWQSTAAINNRVVMVADTNNLIGLPDGFEPWSPAPGSESTTATPSGINTSFTNSSTMSSTGFTTTTAGGGGLKNIWPTGAHS